MMLSSDPSPDPIRGKRIVLVEDEGVTQMQMQRILKVAGLLVVGFARNGQEAVEVVLRERPDLVLIDMNMPVMDGMEAARRILAEYTPCLVFLTAYNEEERRQEAQTIGAHGYVVKPVLAAQLLPQLQIAWTNWQTAQQAQSSETTKDNQVGNSSQ